MGYEMEKRDLKLVGLGLCLEMLRMMGYGYIWGWRFKGDGWGWRFMGDVYVSGVVRFYFIVFLLLLK